MSIIVSSTFLNIDCHYDEKCFTEKQPIFNYLTTFERDWMYYLKDFLGSINDILNVLKEKGRYVILIDDGYTCDEIIFKMD